MLLMPPPTVRGTKQLFAVSLTLFNKIFLFSLDAVISKKHISSAPPLSYIFACSTGSPASFRFTKLMPFTTLPSLTSRQV
jgi:hypothetical protein